MGATCSSGTPCRGRRPDARCVGHRATHRRRSVARARPRCAAACSCRSRWGRGWRRSRFPKPAGRWTEAPACRRTDARHRGPKECSFTELHGRYHRPRDEHQEAAGMSSPLGPLLRKLQSATIGKPKAAPDSVERRQLEAEFQARRQQLEEQMRQRGAELTQREDFLQRVTDTLPGMVAYWNRDGLCEFANAAYGAWFGRSRDEMIGLHARDMLGDEEYARGRPMIETVLAGQSHQIERTLTNQQGEVRHFYSHYVPNWRDGQVHG